MLALAALATAAAGYPAAEPAGPPNGHAGAQKLPQSLSTNRSSIAVGRCEVTAMQNARQPSLRRVRGLIILTIILMACYGLHQVGAKGIDRALMQATAALSLGAF